MKEEKKDCDFNSFGYCRHKYYSEGYCADTDDCPLKQQTKLTFEEAESEN